MFEVDDESQSEHSYSPFLTGQLSFKGRQRERICNCILLKYDEWRGHWSAHSPAFLPSFLPTPTTAADNVLYPVMSSPTTNNNGAPALPLPHRREASAPKGNKPPVWAVENTTTPSVPEPLTAKCARHQTGREGVCCKELKGDDERTLIDPDVVRDV